MEDEHGGVSAVEAFVGVVGYFSFSDASDIKRGRCRKTVLCGRSSLRSTVISISSSMVVNLVFCRWCFY